MQWQLALPPLWQNVNVEFSIQLQLHKDWMQVCLLTCYTIIAQDEHIFTRGIPQDINMFMAACLSAKESFTSRMTSEPAIQQRRHELAGVANVSAQSRLLLSHRLTHSLAFVASSPCHLQSRKSKWHIEGEAALLTTPPTPSNLHGNRLEKIFLQNCITASYNQSSRTMVLVVTIVKTRTIVVKANYAFFGLTYFESLQRRYYKPVCKIFRHMLYF